MKNDKLPQPPGSRQARPSQTSYDFHELQESLDAAGAADDEETQPSLRTLKRRANEQVLHPFGGNRDEGDPRVPTPRPLRPRPYGFPPQGWRATRRDPIDRVPQDKTDHLWDIATLPLKVLTRRDPIYRVPQERSGHLWDIATLPLKVVRSGHLWDIATFPLKVVRSGHLWNVTTFPLKMLKRSMAKPLSRRPAAMKTLPLPAFRLRFIVPRDAGNDTRERIRSYDKAEHISKRQVRKRMRLSLIKDGWLVATLIIACVTSITSLWYFFQQHQILLYGDAYSHMLIARRLFDNLTPGLAQLGGVWLPLPHLAMAPFIWNDYLWHTGLAGSFVSMPCYIIASVYLFLSARRLTKSSRASFVGTLLFILNPNILYLQTTPLSELVLIAALTASGYYFLAWVQTDLSKYLVLAAAATFLSTLARYDGWVLFLTQITLIVIIGWMKHNRWSRIEGNLIIFGSLGGLGIVLWFLWCAFIFGDPLYFQRGPFSAQAQQKELISAHLLYTYHDPLQSIRYYMIDCIDTLGPVLFTLCILAIIVFVLHRRFTPEALAALAFLIPVPFYVFSLYTGQASLYLPEAVPGYASYQLFNARYGAMVVAPASLFLALLASFIVPALRQPLLHRSFIRRAGRTAGQYIGHLACVSIIIFQVVLIAQNGIITLRDGQYGLACTPTHTIVIYLSQHYAGGRILEDLYTSKIDSLEPTAGIDFKNIVYEGSSQLWIKALSHPEMVVDWIIVNPSDAGDYLARQIHLTSPAFSSHFTFILQEQNGLTLYHRNGLPPLPWRQAPRSVFTEHRLCGAHDLAQSDNLLNLIRIWKAGQH